MTNYKSYSRPATDVYSKKHIDRQFDRFERLYDLLKKKNSDLRHRVTELERRLSFTVPEYRDDEQD